MDLVLLLGSGVGLLALGFVVVRLQAILREARPHVDQTVSDPILLDGWEPPPQGPRHPQTPVP